MAAYEISLFVFRRDLRLEDNTALRAAALSSRRIFPCFFLDPRQLENNPYLSEAALSFMRDSLVRLESDIRKIGGRLHFFKGTPESCLKNLRNKIRFQALFMNRDYTPFSRKRDESLRLFCEKNRIAFHLFDDALLHAPEVTVKKNGSPYSVFTPFYRNASLLPVNPPVSTGTLRLIRDRIAGEERSWQSILNVSFSGGARGGRSEGLRLLSRLGEQERYAKTHDIPSIRTTRLSAHLKFGTLSIRETYHAIGRRLGLSHPLLRQLYWRDFFTSIAFHFPHVFGGAFHPQYDKVPWMKDVASYKRWCEGTTGFPIVDAGMRELAQTGFMHNRVRMITASFLVKDLHVDWRWGERYFASKLSDYDPAVNNGNWQWAASTGCDAQPYFRIFNPWRQQLRFDPECSYIKRWVPELASLLPKQIHGWAKERPDRKVDYPSPLCDHAKESARALLMYRRIFS